MTKLRLAPNLALPVEAAGETFLIVGKRGSGKSSTATRFAEQLIRAKVPIAVLDPVDVWWGLKAGGDGKRAGGLEVYVFGGDHADLPLEPSAGILLADVVVDHRVNVVMVLRAFSNREKARFVSDFAEQLYRRNRETMHLFCEEAHEVMPQNPYAGEEEMLGRMLRLEKQGRTSGIGMTAITQRPASLNKNATTQAEILVAHRILGPQDVKAIDGWIQHHHQQEKRQEVLATLGELKTGEAWVWAPDFPEDAPVGLKRVQVLMPETFDSRRTPKPGERRTQPKELAAVDLEQRRTKMASASERQKADDPKALRAEIARLRGELGKANKELLAPARAVAPSTVVKRAVLSNGTTKALDAISKTWLRATEAMLKAETVALDRAKSIRAIAGELASAIQPVQDELARITSVPSVGPIAERSATVGPTVRAGKAEVGQSAGVPVQPRPTVTTSRSVDGAGVRGRGLTSGAGPAGTTEGITTRQQRFLDAAATLTTLGVEVSRETVAAWVGVHPRGGSVGEELGALVAANLISLDRGRITVTVLGERSANVTDAQDAIEQATRALSPRQRRMFELAREVYPESTSRDAIAERLGLHPRGGSLGEDLGRLRGRGLITYDRGQVRARDFLFAGAR